MAYRCVSLLSGGLRVIGLIMLNGWKWMNFYKDLINFGITFFWKYYLGVGMGGN
jgi:hypothetical protein